MNFAEDKKEEVAEFKVQFDIVLAEIEERVEFLEKMLEEHRYDEETKKGCLTIDPTEYLQYISIDKESMAALLEQETKNWADDFADTQKEAQIQKDKIEVLLEA